ncbi:NAD(P)-binding domain-containing protein [Streptomyces sp. NBC_00237]|uniref:NAD(P)-dependent oxidoreductase n=1 Tax=Streptomyces sp. NBC_00237 TaxID=2975687 RepID=UPI0022532EC8|nr:NAD(P)-binding domain-containing protein [Streptomyces sp. NBC_00237]MCX5203857.1 NAD(P)-binding domain-containing protein [Streptomyces sp. NBC_00237]
MTTQKSVTVIGLGPMGRAMSAAYLDAGYRVTVFNRTPSRADELVARGAHRADSIEQALSANELSILSLTDYDAVYALLESEAATAALSGRVLVNLSSDTPDRAREAAEWAASHGAQHLTGGVGAPPTSIGDPEMYTYYSGPKDVFEQHKDVLEVLTRADYKGEDPGLGALYYQLQMDMFWTGLTSWLHALAVARANGITAEDLLPYATDVMGTMPGFFAHYTPRVDAGENGGELERLSMGIASIDHVLHTTKAAGVDPTLPAAVLETFRRGAAAGHSENSLTSLVEVFTKGA